MPQYNIYTVSKVVSLYTVEADSEKDAKEEFDAGQAISAGFVDSEEEIIQIEKEII